jgi:hypothetical protein
MLPVRLTMVAVVVAGIGVGAYHNDFLQPTRTRLEIEISGGFAYIPSRNDRRLHIAYLNDVVVREAGAVVCEVDQVGTELMVVRGVIDLYDGRDPMPPTRIFNLDEARLLLPRLENAINIPLNTPRNGWKPTPLKAASPAHWRDLQYVPRITEHGNLKNHQIVPAWQKHPNINGFITLRGGTLEGTTPSDPIAERALFEYRASGEANTQVSSTDKTIYRVEVPDDKVDIVFTQSALGYRRLVIKPNSPSEPVRLRLRGLHSMNSPPKDGDELKDFCAFHTLLTPEVKSPDYVRIFYKAPPRPPGGQGMPSPGFFCDGNMF